jgi:hypothetical protein
LIGAVQIALLYLAPAVLLAVALLAGRYPGAAVLERLARPVRGRRLRPPRRSRPPRVPVFRVVEAELAWSLAGRAPPC